MILQRGGWDGGGALDKQSVEEQQSGPLKSTGLERGASVRRDAISLSVSPQTKTDCLQKLAVSIPPDKESRGWLYL